MGCHQYADDTTLCFSLSSEAGEAVQVLICSLDAVMEWMRAGQLKFNSDKVETLWLVGPHIRELDRSPGGWGMLLGGIPRSICVTEDPGDFSGSEYLCTTCSWPEQKVYWAGVIWPHDFMH